MKWYYCLLILLIPSFIYANEIKTKDGESNMNAVVGEVEIASTNDIEIKWDKMIFTYNISKNYTWDSNTHKYIYKGENKYWTNNGNTITIINKTNKKIIVTPIFNSNNNNLTGKFNNNSLTINSFENKKLEFSLSGSINKTNTNTKAGHITINFE